MVPASTAPPVTEASRTHHESATCKSSTLSPLRVAAILLSMDTAHVGFSGRFWPPLAGITALAFVLVVGGYGPYLSARVASATLLAALVAWGVWRWQDPARGRELSRRRPILVSFLWFAGIVAMGFARTGDPEAHVYVGELMIVAAEVAVGVHLVVLERRRAPELPEEAEPLVRDVVHAVLEERGSTRGHDARGLRDLMGEGGAAATERILEGERGIDLVEGLSPADAAVVANVLARLRLWEIVPPAGRRAILRMPWGLQVFLASTMLITIFLSVAFAAMLLPWPPGWVR